MKPAPFEYHAPTSAADAVALLAELGDGAKLLAGGQSLVPILALRLTVFEHLVDLRRVDELRGIERADGRVRIGAMTTQSAIEHSDEIAGAVPLLARATGHIGHFQIRNRGTIGGSLAHADPAAEYPAVALALDAEVDVLSANGSRPVPAAGLFDGMWTTTMAEHELLTAVSFPVWSGRCGFAIEELARRHGDFALAGACVAVELADRAGGAVGDEIERCAISLFGVGPTPLRASSAEAAATGVAAADVGGEELGRLAVAGLDGVPSDIHGSAAYRRDVAAVMVARAWRRAVEEARGG